MPLPTNSESRALGKGKKFQKIFDLKFGMMKKSWSSDPPPAKNLESTTLSK